MTKHEAQDVLSLIGRVFPNTVSSKWGWSDEIVAEFGRRLLAIDINPAQAHAAVMQLAASVTTKTPAFSIVLRSLSNAAGADRTSEQRERTDTPPLLAPDLARSRIAEKLFANREVLSDLADQWRGHNAHTRGRSDESFCSPTEETRNDCDNFLRWAAWQIKRAQDRERARKEVRFA